MVSLAGFGALADRTERLDIRRGEADLVAVNPKTPAPVREAQSWPLALRVDIVICVLNELLEKMCRFGIQLIRKTEPSN